MASTSVFKDRGVLDFDWVPPELPHREQALRALTSVFQNVLEGHGSQNALVTGSVGTGKTVVARSFGSEFRKAARDRGRELVLAYVNCRSNASEGLVMTEVLRKLLGRYPAKGFSTQEMLRDLRVILAKREADLLLVLDEADALVQKAGSDLVYQFTRFNQGEPTGPRVNLVLVSMFGDLLDRLDEAARSTFKRSNVLRLERYSSPELVDILSQRVRLGFHAGTVDDQVVELIGDIAAEEGDARYAIELLEHAGRLADGEKLEAVEAEHVRAAKANTRSFVTESKLKLLDSQLLFVLVAVGRRLRRTRAPFATTGEVEDVYQVVAEEYGEPARAHTQFWKYLKQLEGAGWLRVKAASGGKSGKTQHISLPDVPAGVLLEKLEAVLAERAGSPIGK